MSAQGESISQPTRPCHPRLKGTWFMKVYACMRWFNVSSRSTERIMICPASMEMTDELLPLLGIDLIASVIITAIYDGFFASRFLPAIPGWCLGIRIPRSSHGSRVLRIEGIRCSRFCCMNFAGKCFFLESLSSWMSFCHLRSIMQRRWWKTILCRLMRLCRFRYLNTWLRLYLLIIYILMGSSLHFGYAKTTFLNHFIHILPSDLLWFL